MKELSIRFKITMWFSALIVVIVVMTFSLMLAIDRHVLNTDMKKTLIQVVEANAGELEYHEDIVDEEIEPGDRYLIYRDGYLEIDDDFLGESQGVFTVIMDEAGNIIYGEQAANVAAERSGKVESRIADGEKYYIYSHVLTEGELSGIIVQGMANEDAGETMLTRTVGLSLLLLPLLGVVVIVGGYLLAGRMFNPIRQIISAAEGISDGADLSLRIELGRGKDELHQLANSFNRMFSRLECSFEKEKQFTSDISHELRTPVSTILAQTEAILERERTAREYQAALALIQRQGIRMKHLVNQMLQYSRLERMEMLPESEVIDLSGLAEMIADEQKLNSERGIVLEDDISPGIEVIGDMELLVRMLVNLIANAYRYGRENGHILVRLYESGGQAHLSVRDDGIGIAANDKEKIFHRFYQVDKARSSSNESLGLGLSMVSEIARLHRAQVEIDSEPGIGSTFTVVFPCHNHE